MTMAASVRNLLIGVTLMVLAAAGCGNHTESESPRQPVVPRKKIGVPKEPTPQAAKPSGEATVKPEMAKLRTEPAQEAQTAVKKAREKVSGTKAVMKPPLQQPKVEPPSAEKKRLIQPAGSGSEFLAEVVGKKLAYFYDPKGKPDPFKPLFGRGAERVAPAKKMVKKKRLPLTPLQRVDLSQLKLVGIIISPAGNKALVEEPSGKGYIVSKGTYIGTNFGHVKQILKDKVIVEEKVEDFISGETKLQTTELRLQKKIGDV